VSFEMTTVAQPNDLEHLGIIRVMGEWSADFPTLGASIRTNQHPASNSRSDGMVSNVLRSVLCSVPPITGLHLFRVPFTPGASRLQSFGPGFRSLTRSPLTVACVFLSTILLLPLFVVGANVFAVLYSIFFHASKNLVSVLQILFAVVCFLYFRISVWHGGKFNTFSSLRMA